MMNVAAGPAMTRQAVKTDSDVVSARQKGRAMASDTGFSRSDQALIATAISELARNIVNYAGVGEIVLRVIHKNASPGLQITASDTGPGIEDIEAALLDGFSTGNSLGLGLPGTRRIMDDFDILSAPDEGLTVTAVKWL